MAEIPVPDGLLKRHGSSKTDDIIRLDDSSSEDILETTDHFETIAPTATLPTIARPSSPFRRHHQPSSSPEVPPRNRRHRPFASSLTMDGSASTALEEELTELGRLDSPFADVNAVTEESVFVGQGIKKRLSPTTTISTGGGEDSNHIDDSTSAAVEKFEDEESMMYSSNDNNKQDPRVGENNGDATPFKKKMKNLTNFENLRNMPCFGWLVLNLVISILGTAIVLSLYYSKDGGSGINIINNNNTPGSSASTTNLIDGNEAITRDKMTSSVLGLGKSPEEEEDEDITEVPQEDGTTTEAPTHELSAQGGREGSAPPLVVVKQEGDEYDSSPAARQAVRKIQMDNFKNDRGSILLNFLIQGHAGTTIRREFQNSLPCPSFACLFPTEQDGVPADYPDSFPWTNDDTSLNIQKVHDHFRFLMWQFNGPPPHGQPEVHETSWEDPNLVSILVIREPISRTLAGNAVMGPKYPNIITGHNPAAAPATKEQWMAFANEPFHTNNFALRVLSDETCCDGADTSRHYLDKAKDLVQRFTFVLDINCLEHSLDKVADLLGVQVAHFYESEDNCHDHTPARDRIPYPEVYEYLVERNKLDIELYEFAKSRALLDCDAVYAAEAAMKAATAGEDGGE